MIKYKDLEGLYYSEGESATNRMYEQRFNSEATYIFDAEISGFPAFTVNNRDVLKYIDMINEKNLILNEMTNSLPGIACEEYVKKCLIDEVKLTSEIEGVNSTRKEIGQLMDDIQGKPEVGKNKRLYGLVQKYMMLLDNKEISLNSCEDVRTLYDDLVWAEVESDDPSNLPDGEIFRKENANVINSSQKVIHVGVRSEAKIVDYMNKLINILHDNEYNYFVRVSVAHYFIGYIHPFYDGNGRLSRFISSYMLSRRLNSLVSFGLSLTIKENIKTYYKMFTEINKERNKGELTSFVINFLNIINVTMDRIFGELNEKGKKLEFYRLKLDGFCNSKKGLRVSDTGKLICWALIQITLFGESGLSLKDMLKINGNSVSESNLRLHIKSVRDLLIEEKRGREKIYSIKLELLDEF